jgi:nitroimidazol reductase NimA-like FMN-containing flavoprotein (pyridoxamine 5'-phosphate oxidase superfamily)
MEHESDPGGLGLTNPWLAGPAPVRPLPRDELEERILNLLSTHNTCVVATTGPDGPLATPVRYHHLGFTLVFTAEEGSPKLRNLERDPRLSVGLVAPLVGQASSRGAQLFGTARVLRAGDEGFDRLMGVYRWQSDAVERGRPVGAEHAPAGPAVAIDVQRIVYTEHWLRRRGYAPRQHWRRSDRGSRPG